MSIYIYEFIYIYKGHSMNIFLCQNKFFSIFCTLPNLKSVCRKIILITRKRLF